MDKKIVCEFIFLVCIRYKLAEVISMLEADDEFQSADIFILLPKDPTRSDEDSGPEDDEGDIDNLTGNQLRADAEATITVSGVGKKADGWLRYGR